MAILLDNSGNIASSGKFGGAGGTGVEKRIASQFTATGNWSVTSVDLSVNEDTGDPGGNASTSYDVEIVIQGDTAGHLPDETNIIATAFAAHNEVNSGPSYVAPNIAISASLVNGTKYWLAIRTRSSADDSNYYGTHAITASGTGARFNNGTSSDTWAASTLDLYYIINGSGGAVGATVADNSLLLMGVGT